MRINRDSFQGDLGRVVVDSPVGKMNMIASSKGLRALLWERDHEDEDFDDAIQAVPVKENVHLERAATQLEEYFRGERVNFDVALDPIGTDFQKKAWDALVQIPYGETRSYLEQALVVGNKNHTRAVGGANSRNPVSIIIPCHRVIGKSGDLTGFAGGISLKKFLLDLESNQMPLISPHPLSAQ